ncbi:hypothetical protein [Haloarcula marina]|uniref:hypothetical protein n=1 Tax=Haloarcula marina TaxID=2961574 RepID=UPI0020B71CB7|nr:hypothetical protein [Halomicroarcula marina]
MGLFDSIRRAVGGDDESAGAGESSTGTDDAAHDSGGESAVARIDVTALDAEAFRTRAADAASDADPLDFSRASLERLDTAIADRDDWVEESPADEDGYSPKTVQFGSYFGETLVRVYDGEWTTEGGWVVTVEGVDDSVTVSVFEVAARSIGGDPVFSAVAARLDDELTLPAEDVALIDDGDDGDTDPGVEFEDLTESEERIPPAPLKTDEAADTAGDDPNDPDADDADSGGDGSPTALEPTAAVADSSHPEAAHEVGELEGTAVTEADPAEMPIFESKPDPETIPVFESKPDPATMPVFESEAAASSRAEAPAETADGLEPTDGETTEQREETGREATDSEAVAADEAATADDGEGTEGTTAAESDAVAADAEGEGVPLDRDAGQAAADTDDRADEAPTETTAADTAAASDVGENELEAAASTDETAADERGETRGDESGATPSPETPSEKSETDPSAATDAAEPEPPAETESKVESDGERESEPDPAETPSETADSAADPHTDGRDADSAAETARDADADTETSSSPATDESGPQGVRAEYAETADDFAAFWTEHDLDYTPESLARLDALVGSEWDDDRFADAVFGSEETFDDRAFTSVTTELGSYFGEVLVREVDGAWTDETDHEAAVVVDGPSGPLAVPVFQVATNSLRTVPVFARSYEALLADLGREPNAE